MRTTFVLDLYRTPKIRTSGNNADQIFCTHEVRACSQRRLLHARSEDTRTVSMRPLRYVDPDQMRKLSTGIIHETMKGRFSLQGTTRHEPYRHRAKPTHRSLNTAYAVPYTLKAMYNRTTGIQQYQVSSKSLGGAQNTIRTQDDSSELHARIRAPIYTQAVTGNRQRSTASIHKREMSRGSAKYVQ